MINNLVCWKKMIDSINSVYISKYIRNQERKNDSADTELQKLFKARANYKQMLESAKQKNCDMAIVSAQIANRILAAEREYYYSKN